MSLRVRLLDLPFFAEGPRCLIFDSGWFHSRDRRSCLLFNLLCSFVFLFFLPPFFCCLSPPIKGESFAIKCLSPYSASHPSMPCANPERRQKAAVMADRPPPFIQLVLCFKATRLSFSFSFLPISFPSSSSSPPAFDHYSEQRK